MTLVTAEFIRRFLSHVLPSCRRRHFGGEFVLGRRGLQFLQRTSTVQTTTRPSRKLGNTLINVTSSYGDKGGGS